MAIVAITGLPGHGKTLYALQWVKAWAEREGRPVFHNSIPELSLPWFAFKVEDWQTLEAGSIVVIDEAQACFPPRGRGQPPPFIEELAKHRHLGIDFVVITQNPMLIDSFVRRLVDRHFHVVRKFGTHFATVYESTNGIKENIASAREGLIPHEWRYPKEVFSFYKSAELHTVKRRIPARVFVLAFVPVVFLAAAYISWQRLKPKSADPPALVGAAAPGVAGSPATPGQAPGRAGPATPGEYVAAFAPRVVGLPHTAPVYDEVTRPVEAPYPAACVVMGPRCQCYTQQATKLDVSPAMCNSIAAGGFFVGWRSTRELQAVQRGPDLAADEKDLRPVGPGL